MDQWTSDIEWNDAEVMIGIEDLRQGLI
jgi:hypothetical protein